MPHHMRITEDSQYREGVTKNMPNKNGTWVDIGLRQFCHINEKLNNNIRVTIKVDNYIGSASSIPLRKKIKGQAVSPNIPRKSTGIYWGYHTRLVERLGDIFSSCPYPNGYDLIIGTSDKGQDVTQKIDFKLPKFKHLLIVFGGVGGIEDALLGDDRLNIATPDLLFQLYINTCPKQGSRTIRTEEAIPITLSTLQTHILNQ